MRFNPTAFISAASLVSATHARSGHGDLTVKTKLGLIHGTVDSATPAVRQFLGIPYALPPVNHLRFAPPQPAQPFGELDATEMSPSCMQYASSLPSIFTHEVLELNLGGLNGTTGPISEDCLTLSVWAPRCTTKRKLPVLIFFYGGAFMNGGSNVPYLLPAQWIQRTQSHIVVSFNHRGDIFGFPNAAGLPQQEQNIGLLDQRLAIEWVRDNIAAFGGDPERIGLWGESSGGVAIAYYSYAYRSDPVANSVIMDSGNEFIDILTRDPAHNNFTFVASHLGCGNLSPAAELACMRRVDAAAIESFIHSYSDAGTTPILTFSPVIDDRTVFETYPPFNPAPLPALIGSNAQDGVAFVPYSPTGIDAALAEEMTMTFFFCPTYASANTRVAAYNGTEPVYRYLYSGNFTNVAPKPWLGAYHGAELPLVMGTHGLYRGDSTELEVRTSEAMQDAWLNFVATGGRRMSVEGWDGDGKVVEFGNGVPARVVDSSELEGRCGEMLGG
ncbi:acetylcholinesterase [Achaetomium macrosporum]|uniref:Carboxylic ester hydrolase n=1 Tax=Achaetomium macrosporum TaxID=79813 RepID=A0AAN7HBQ6_9PEZI|nr:acetylcholinesterase [Achaetomium macrosporum]